MNTTIKFTTATVILALGMVVSAGVLSKFFVRVKHEKPITVKGYAERDIASDIGSFACTCRVRGASLQEAYAKLQDSRNRVLDYLKRQGFGAAEIRPEIMDTLRINKRNEKGVELNETEFFDAHQTIGVTSTNVALIRDAALGTTDLIKDGLDLVVSPPEFLVSDLKDVKVQLLAKATEDGYRRAQALAANSRAKVGALVAAEQGVLQITRPHSTDTSGGGMYDTSTIEKTAKAVVTLEYTIMPND
ncbi:MAG: SIMPL domain-containing protein [Verrucomicrobia bacterium]|nr:MAG: SIMPL domain-containing protein [Verrucomicrobiota bacterium]